MWHISDLLGQEEIRRNVSHPRKQQFIQPYKHLHRRQNISLRVYNAVSRLCLCLHLLLSKSHTYCCHGTAWILGLNIALSGAERISVFFSMSSLSWQTDGPITVLKAGWGTDFFNLSTRTHSCQMKLENLKTLVGSFCPEHIIIWSQKFII